MINSSRDSSLNPESIALEISSTNNEKVVRYNERTSSFTSQQKYKKRQGNRDSKDKKLRFYRSKTFKIVLQISLTFIIFLAEAITGWYTNCLALLSDSFHTLSDVISLTIGLVAIRFTHKTIMPFSNKTFGYQRAEVLGGICQAVFLYSLCFNIYASAFNRFINPEELKNIEMVLIVGFIGLVVNIIGVFNFWDSGYDGHGFKEDGLRERSGTAASGNNGGGDQPTSQNLNTWGIFLHVLGDTLASVAVMISGGLLYYYDNDTTTHTWLKYVDPSLTFIIATIISISTYPLLNQSIKLLMEFAPDNISIKDFQSDIIKTLSDKKLLGNDNDTSLESDFVENLQIWSLSSSKVVGTAKLVVRRRENENDSELVLRFNQIYQEMTLVFAKKKVELLSLEPKFV